MRYSLTARRLRNLLAVLAVSFGATAPGQHTISVKPASPDTLYGKLFHDVQTGMVFSDSKTFADCIPRFPADTIKNQYARKQLSESALRDFVREHFTVPAPGPIYQSDSLPVKDHITHLWNVLERPADTAGPGSLIPLPRPYIVPGGRFREIYYWDSYFTMLGLVADGKLPMVKNMVINFADLLDRYGFIPNGNRSYYLSRSQPPFFAAMVELLAKSEGDSIYRRFHRHLEKEYQFWMDGADRLSGTKNTYRRVVKMSNGAILNRYWDDNDVPRPESYREDIATAAVATSRLKRNPADVYRNLRAAAESGWDFSSRWLEADTDDKFHLYTIHTTDIVPVDLNCLLYHLEKILATSYKLQGNDDRSTSMNEKATARKKAILNYCWNKSNGFFRDYNFKIGKQTTVQSLAGVFPLYTGIADAQQAQRVKENLERHFLRNGGLVTTLHYTGEQWDAPNGWAPLHWVSITGLRNYGYNDFADTVKNRWLNLNRQVYENSYKLLEKYNVDDELSGGGGEYPTQDGFGWTNGVYQRLSGE